MYEHSITDPASLAVVERHPRLTVEAAGRSAVRDTVPIVVGMVPFGILIGLTLTTHPVGPLVGMASAALFYGGTAHFAALAMIAAGAGAPTVLAGVIVINARLLLYGAALQPRFVGQPWWFRWLAPALMIDQTFALAEALPVEEDPARFRRYWLVSGSTLGVGWLGAHALGLVVGPILPHGLPLRIAAPAVLVGLLVPHLKRPSGVVAAGVAGVGAAVAAPLPTGVGTLVGAAAGLLAATLTGRRAVRA